MSPSPPRPPSDPAISAHPEVHWQQTFVRSRISHAVRIRMRLEHKEHEVRALEEQGELSRVGTPTRL